MKREQITALSHSRDRSFFAYWVGAKPRTYKRLAAHFHCSPQYASKRVYRHYNRLFPALHIRGDQFIATRLKE